MDDCRMLSSVSKITPACTHITELCQQVFIYNDEAHCTSHTSCAQVLQLPQSHFGDSRAIITYVLYPSSFYEIWAPLVACIYTYIYIYIYIIYIYIYIYIYVCIYKSYQPNSTWNTAIKSDSEKNVLRKSREIHWEISVKGLTFL